MHMLKRISEPGPADMCDLCKLVLASSARLSDTRTDKVVPVLIVSEIARQDQVAYHGRVIKKYTLLKDNGCSI